MEYPSRKQLPPAPISRCVSVCEGTWYGVFANKWKRHPTLSKMLLWEKTGSTPSCTWLYVMCSGSRSSKEVEGKTNSLIGGMKALLIPRPDDRSHAFTFL